MSHFMAPLLKLSANDQKKATGVNTQERGSTVEMIHTQLLDLSLYCQWYLYSHPVMSNYYCYQTW